MAALLTEEELGKLVSEMEQTFDKVAASQDKVVGCRAAEVHLLKLFERARDIMLNVVADKDRSVLLRLFGDCSRIARIRVILDSASFSNGHRNHERSATCLRACLSIEGVLRDIGLGQRLSEALEAVSRGHACVEDKRLTNDAMPAHGLIAGLGLEDEPLQPYSPAVPLASLKSEIAHRAAKHLEISSEPDEAHMLVGEPCTAAEGPPAASPPDPKGEVSNAVSEMLGQEGEPCASPERPFAMLPCYPQGEGNNVGGETYGPKKELCASADGPPAVLASHPGDDEKQVAYEMFRPEGEPCAATGGPPAMSPSNPKGGDTKAASEMPGHEGEPCSSAERPFAMLPCYQKVEGNNVGGETSGPKEEPWASAEVPLAALASHPGGDDKQVAYDMFRPEGKRCVPSGGPLAMSPSNPRGADTKAVSEMLGHEGEPRASAERPFAMLHCYPKGEGNNVRSETSGPKEQQCASAEGPPAALASHPGGDEQQVPYEMFRPEGEPCAATGGPLAMSPPNRKVEDTKAVSEMPGQESEPCVLGEGPSATLPLFPQIEEYNVGGDAPGPKGEPYSSAKGPLAALASHPGGDKNQVAYEMFRPEGGPCAPTEGPPAMSGSDQKGEETEAASDMLGQQSESCASAECEPCALTGRPLAMGDATPMSGEKPCVPAQDPHVELRVGPVDELQNVAQMLRTGELRSLALQIFKRRAGAAGCLEWNSRGIARFILEIFEALEIRRPTEHEMYAMYTRVDTNASWSLDEQECLSLIEMLVCQLAGIELDPQRDKAIASVQRQNMARYAASQFNAVDVNGNGLLQWNNGELRTFIVNVFSYCGLPEPAESQMLGMCLKFDSDKDGSLNAEECRCLVETLSRSMYSVQRADSAVCCCNSHVMHLFNASETKHTCNLCSVLLDKRAVFWRCAPCNYNLCVNCSKQRLKGHALAANRCRINRRTLLPLCASVQSVSPASPLHKLALLPGVQNRCGK